MIAIPEPDQPSATPWKVLCALALAAPLLGFAALVHGQAPEPSCADLSGARAYSGPGFDALGAAPQPACVRDELPPPQ